MEGMRSGHRLPCLLGRRAVPRGHWARGGGRGQAEPTPGLEPGPGWGEPLQKETRAKILEAGQVVLPRAPSLLQKILRYSTGMAHGSPCPRGPPPPSVPSFFEPLY